MSETSEQLIARLKQDIDAACADGPNPEWHIYDITKRHAFKAVAREMILLLKETGKWDECKAAILADSGIEVIEKQTTGNNPTTN
jgi:hypothetical protein